ncbi:anaerobic ribonucleoside-triphosphate reductase activating protein [Ruminococcus sp.]|jgi:anaerobic ribonucleoside-triphosphate reductase activating protein|uniref:anaerobic ribonucleoside-triphosphate reductase activating protein n=1 Tax=Ruminococcus sp. TaxID=41978 RepID=UPI0026130437|nr:anaerobic ribonucleoside-triphosphate reductase activating protein [Ruminococcus sp.]MCI2112317.1 anaerobic ribonucleoside-triphosphate reductase activating protein [Ruminococcus sp.]MDD6990084.1 anaerobic ribonucleoside-triphosphate reductase activating protein [Ruminococcus sp.]MDY6201871.1 anaerobic ribonucleoside-triphosphate reductase activating protein [Ruminococcus sp.]
MNYGEIKNYDIANGEGVRVSLFVSGCTHHCKNCFNPETWSFEYGKPFTKETEDYIIECLSPDYIDGLSLLGGEPFEPQNQKVLLPFLRRVRSELPDKTIWCYTGYLFDKELLSESRARCEFTDEMLSMIDVLVDGEFVQALHDISLAFRGSSNQRIIDVQKSLETGEIKLHNLMSRNM